MGRRFSQEWLFSAIFGVCAGVIVASSLPGRAFPMSFGAALAGALGTALWLRWFPMRSRLPWFALLVPFLALPELVIGTPSLVRSLFALLLSLVAVVSCSLLERVSLEPSSRVVSRSFYALVAVMIVLGWAALTYKFLHFGERFISQDTAYFEQGIWGFVTGHNFFMASSQGWWRYDPPLSSHFAMHFSPVLFPLAAAYWLCSSYHLLHFFFVAAIFSAAIPVFFLVRRIDPVAAFLFGLAYLLNPAVFSQTQGGFHLLAFAAPAVTWAIYFFSERRLGPFLGCLVAAICVREDLALAAAAAGVAAGMVSLLDRERPFPHRFWWVAGPICLGTAGWVLAGRVMALFERSGDQVILSLFGHLGSSPGEVLNCTVHDPLYVVRTMLEGHRCHYLLGLFRPGLLGALVHPLSLMALPALLVNLLVRGAGTAWLDVHYSVYLPAVLMPAAIIVWLRWTPFLAARVGATTILTRRTVALLMICSSLLSLPEVAGSRQLSYYRVPDDFEDIQAVLESIPPEVSVAAPRHMLHALAKREKLYIVNRWRQYSIYDPEYVAVETDFSKAGLNDGTLEQYQAYAGALATDPDFEVVVRRPRLILYHRVGPGAPRAVSSEPLPSFRIAPEPTLPEPTLPDPSLPEPSLPDPSLPGPTLSDPSPPVPTAPVLYHQASPDASNTTTVDSVEPTGGPEAL